MRPGTRLVVAIAPGFTIGFVRPSSLRSIAETALNGRPVASTPTSAPASAMPIASQTSANTNGLATLMIANSTSASPAVNTLPPTPATQIPKRSLGTRASAG